MKDREGSPVGPELARRRMRQVGKRREQSLHRLPEGAVESPPLVQAVAAVGKEQDFDALTLRPAAQNFPQHLSGMDLPAG